MGVYPQSQYRCMGTEFGRLGSAYPFLHCLASHRDGAISTVFREDRVSHEAADDASADTAIAAIRQAVEIGTAPVLSGPVIEAVE